MQINIKTSGENQAIVTQLTKKLTGGTKRKRDSSYCIRLFSVYR